VNLDALFPTGKCNGVKFADPTLTPVTLLSHVLFPAPSTAELDFDNLLSNASCTFDLLWKAGGTLTPDTANLPTVFMVDLDVGTRDVVLPLVITYAGCASASTDGIVCTPGPNPLPTDTVFSCAQ
jgi:hypothetical protein